LVFGSECCTADAGPKHENAGISLARREAAFVGSALTQDLANSGSPGASVVERPSQ
jgi:hypothetical protein